MCCLENIRSTVNNPLSTKLADKQAIEANSWGGWGRELGPRNDVLTTYKTVTLSGGQRIILQYFEKRTSRENNSIIEKLISCLFVFLAYCICSLILNWIAKHKRHSLQPCKFLTDNNACWTIYRVYGYFDERGEDYRSYDAKKNYWRMCQIKRG